MIDGQGPGHLDRQLLIAPQNREKHPERNNELIALAVWGPTQLDGGVPHEFQLWPSVLFD